MPRTNPPTKILERNDLTYTIIGFDMQNNPYVTFHCDEHTEICGSCPTDDLEEAKLYLANYVKAYIKGAAATASIQTTPIISELHKLIGKKQKPGSDLKG
jgi:hypothetical protein